MSFVLPVGGQDRADGVTPLPPQPLGSNGGNQTLGTANPAGDFQYFSNGGNENIQEETTSPEAERAEQATFLHRMRMGFQIAYSYWSNMPRGTFLRDLSGNVWRLLSTKIQSDRGGMAFLSYSAESISFDTPPDEFDIVPVELGVDILKHPRYFWALNPIASDNTTFYDVGDINVSASQIKIAIIRAIQSYRDSPFYPSQDNINGLIQNNVLSFLNGSADGTSTYMTVNYPNPNFVPSQTNVDPVVWDGVVDDMPSDNCPYFIVSVPVDLTNPDDPIAIAIAAAKEIISKLWRQEDTPYVVGWEITWTQYFFSAPYENPGGYIENPLDVVPDYFTDPSVNNVLARGVFGLNSNNDTVPPNPNAIGTGTIFDLLATINPQSYSNDRTNQGDVVLSSLRKADEIHFERTWFRNTHRWLVSPVGYFDPDLYLLFGANGPQNANDFNQYPVTPTG